MLRRTTSSGSQKWAFITGLLNGLILWMRERGRDRDRKRFKKKQKKLRKKQERASQSVQSEADDIRRY